MTDKYKLVDGQVVALTTEEIAEYDAEVAAGAAARLQNEIDTAKEDLYQSVKDFQNKSCDANFYTLLLVIKGVSTTTPPYAQACLDWLDSLWTEYYTRKGLITELNTVANLDFSTFGSCPYTFLEVRTEYEALP